MRKLSIIAVLFCVSTVVARPPRIVSWHTDSRHPHIVHHSVYNNGWGWEYHRRVIPRPVILPPPPPVVVPHHRHTIIDVTPTYYVPAYPYVETRFEYPYREWRTVPVYGPDGNVIEYRQVLVPVR